VPVDPVEAQQEVWQAQAKEQLQRQIHQGLEAQQGPLNPIQDQWFRDFNDAIHERISKLTARDEEGRKHLYNLLHVAMLFKKGMEFYVLQGENAKIELNRMMDEPKRKWGIL
jgi:hypothetical protein